MSFTKHCNEIFNRAIHDYHVNDDIDAPIQNPFEEGSIENRLYLKCWIDTVQWHFEDIIRDPHIDPVAALALKRRIDKSNQERTDLVEQIDSYFRTRYKAVHVLDNARLNTESALLNISSSDTPQMFAKLMSRGLIWLRSITS